MLISNIHMTNKKHFSQIDFIRFICCLGIIIYHFACHANSKIVSITTTVNSNIGSIIVTIFFIVSGFVLYHNNSEIKSLKVFYYKRFKSIFPSFYICWFIFYTINVIKVRNPFYAGSPLKFLLTLIGQDGYFIQRIINYYTVGEWFLGALIIVYLLYPLLLKGFNKNDKITLLVLIVLTSLVIAFNIPVISPGFPGICESCLKFYIGMMLCKYSGLMRNRYVIVVSVAFVLIYTLIRISVFNNLLDIVYSVTIYILLFDISELIKCKTINKSITDISKISYQIFLFQHMIIQYTFQIYNPKNLFLSIIVLFICMIVTIICAKVLYILVNRIYKTKLYVKLENKILNC